jgi:protein-S-isoprenylcysteine O-methyltransferase Ste14
LNGWPINSSGVYIPITITGVGFKLISIYLDFQTAKRLYLRTGNVPYKLDKEDLDRGFVVTGLWSWSRHPNFAAEQAIWVVLYQWTCFVTQTAYNWTIIGAVSYLTLFQASTWFTELISAGKYSQYGEYRQRVGKFLPKLFTGFPLKDSRKAAVS